MTLSTEGGKISEKYLIWGFQLSDSSFAVLTSGIRLTCSAVSKHSKIFYKRSLIATRWARLRQEAAVCVFSLGYWKQQRIGNVQHLCSVRKLSSPCSDESPPADT